MLYESYPSLIHVSVTDLTPIDTTDSPHYYTFKVVCTSCREEHANWVGVNRHVCDALPLSGKSQDHIKASLVPVFRFLTNLFRSKMIYPAPVAKPILSGSARTASANLRRT